MTLTLSQMIEGLAPARVVRRPDGDISVGAFRNDSRAVEPGDVFVALTDQRDGHDFVPDALRRGARAVIAARPVELPPATERDSYAYLTVESPLAGLQRLAGWWRDQIGATVIGVTGSVGKTTTKEAVSGLLSLKSRVSRSKGNLNNEIGLPMALLSVEKSDEFAVLEMGAYTTGEIRSLCEIARPDLGLVSAIGPVHLERFGSMQAIVDAKAELVEALPPSGVALLNGDDPHLRCYPDRTHARPFLYGVGPGLDLVGEDVQIRGLQGVSGRMSYAGASAEFETPLVGRPGLYVALSAVATAVSLGWSLADACAGLSVVRQSLRLRPIRTSNGALIVDDTYNASPAAVEAALDLIATIPGRRIAILGDMYELGEMEETGHRQVGIKSAQVADTLVAVGPKSRQIQSAAKTAGLEDSQWVAGTADVDYSPGPGDVILVKGSRGMRMETIVERLTEMAGGSSEDSN